MLRANISSKLISSAPAPPAVDPSAIPMLIPLPPVAPSAASPEEEATLPQLSREAEEETAGGAALPAAAPLPLRCWSMCGLVGGLCMACLVPTWVTVGTKWEAWEACGT